MEEWLGRTDATVFLKLQLKMLRRENRVIPQMMKMRESFHYLWSSSRIIELADPLASRIRS